MESRADRVLLLETLEAMKKFPAVYKKLKRDVLAQYRTIQHRHYERPQSVG